MNNLHKIQLFGFGLSFVIASIFLPATAGVVQGQDFQINDIISAPIKGREYEGKVIALRGGGQYLNVTFSDGAGNLLNRTIRASTAKLVRRPKPTSKTSPAKNSGTEKKGKTTMPARPDLPPVKAAESGKGVRIWTKKNGEQLLEGKLLDQVDGVARFEKSDGDVTDVEIKTLSIFDRILLNKLALDVRPNSFAIGDQKKATDSFKIQKVDLKKVKSKALVGVSSWNYQPDPAPKAIVPDQYYFEFQNDGVKTSSQEMFVSNFGQAAVYRPDSRGKKILVVNLRAGELELGFQLPDASMKLHHVNSKYHVLTSKDERLDVLNGKSGEQVISLVFRNKIQRAEFINDNLIWVIDSHYKAFVLPTSDYQPIYTYKDKISAPTAFSQGRNFLAVGTDYGIAIVRASDGTVVGSIRGEQNMQSFAFSPSGKKLFSTRLGQVYLWDLESGQMVDEFKPEYAGLGVSHWIDEDLILLSSRNILSTKLRKNVWRYRGADGKLSHIGGGFFWFLSSSQDLLATLSKIPHPAAETKISGMLVNDTKILEPGTRVRLQIDLPLAPEEKEKLVANFTKQLEGRECVVDKNGQAVLRFFAEDGKPKKVLFSTDNPRGTNVTALVTYTPKYCWVKLMSPSGDVLWQRSSICEPLPVVAPGLNETFEEAIKRHCTPTASTYASGRIPKFKLTKSNPLDGGNSKLIQYGK